MRSIIVLLVLATTLVSCGEYQKVLKTTDMAAKYQMADSLFTEKKYKKAFNLLEQIDPYYRGRPEGERVQYLYATSMYLMKDYHNASSAYEHYARSFPQSDSAEVAAFRSVESYYRISPAYTLDQERTIIGLDKLQEYLAVYSDSKYTEEVNKMSAELQGKLDRKEFSIAKQYLHIMDYKAAIAALDNFIRSSPGSEFQEEAYLRKIEAAYLLGKNSLPVLVKERMQTASSYYKEYKKYYTEGDAFYQEAESFAKKIDEALLKEETTS